MICLYFVSETDVYSFTCTSIVAYALSCVKIQSNIFLWHSFLEAIIIYKKGIELIAWQVFTYHFIIDYIPSNIVTVWSTASFSDLRLVIVEVEVMEERHMRWCAFFLGVTTEAPILWVPTVTQNPSVVSTLGDNPTVFSHCFGWWTEVEISLSHRRCESVHACVQY